MLPARIEAKFVPEPNSGCWMWTAALNQGYGYVGWEGRTRKAATVIYELLRGPVPPGLELDHLCRVTACVNPWHLEAVTHRVNILRGESPAAHHAVKTHCSQGHPYTPNNIRSFRGERRCRACSQARNNGRGRGHKALHTHCPAGHPFDAVNTYLWRGSRHCRACRRAAMQ
jgi:hypothetical protein